MDYLLTFEDGSSGYLAHHGTKGMKWGVWNAETRARRTGTTKTSPFRNEYEKQSYEDKKAGYETGSFLRNKYGIVSKTPDEDPNIDKAIQEGMKKKRKAEYNGL